MKRHVIVVRRRFARARLPLKRPELVDALGAEALPRHEAEYGLNLVQPAAVFWRVVHGQPCPELCALDRLGVVEQCLLAVGV